MNESSQPTLDLASVRNDIESAMATFLAVGPGFYGFGETPKEAIRNCRKAGCRVKEKMLLFAGDDSISINDWGVVEAKQFLLRIGEIQ